MFFDTTDNRVKGRYRNVIIVYCSLRDIGISSAYIFGILSDVRTGWFCQSKYGSCLFRRSYWSNGLLYLHELWTLARSVKNNGNNVHKSIDNSTDADKKYISGELSGMRGQYTGTVVNAVQ